MTGAANSLPVEALADYLRVQGLAGQAPRPGRHGDGESAHGRGDYHVPFGGRKGCSYGPREQGRYAQAFFTTVKTAYTLA